CAPNSTPRSLRLSRSCNGLMRIQEQQQPGSMLSVALWTGQSRPWQRPGPARSKHVYMAIFTWDRCWSPQATRLLSTLRVSQPVRWKSVAPSLARCAMSLGYYVRSTMPSPSRLAVPKALRIRRPDRPRCWTDLPKTRRRHSSRLIAPARPKADCDGSRKPTSRHCSTYSCWKRQLTKSAMRRRAVPTGLEFRYADWRALHSGLLLLPRPRRMDEEPRIARALKAVIDSRILDPF